MTVNGGKWTEKNNPTPEGKNNRTPRKGKKRAIIRREILRLAEVMEKVMSKNDSVKGDSWKYMSTDTMLEILKKEYKELISSSSYENDSKECVDLANCCMMLWHLINFRPRGRGESSGMVERYVREWDNGK